MMKWSFADRRAFVESHVSDYETVFDAFYEYPKNLEEEGATTIHIDFDYAGKKVLIYGDSKGLDAEGLYQLSQSVGKSSKDTRHHGLGILAFFRFAKRMVMFSKKNGIIYVLSCKGHEEDLFSDVEPRPINAEEIFKYSNAIGKLKRWKEGSVTVLEDVGEYHTRRFDFRFDMNKEFDYRRFEHWFKNKSGFNLKYYNYYLKFGDGKPRKLNAKLGVGSKISFTIPSPAHPFKNQQGEPRNFFTMDNRYHELRCEFDFWVSTTQQGEIRIAENRQNALLMRDAFRNSYKVHPTSLFRNGELSKYLQGLINFKVKPVDGGDPINTYSGSRSRLLLDNAFGGCLANILLYAETEVLKPLATSYLQKHSSNRKEKESKELQEDMEAFFRAHQRFFEDIVHTSSTDIVSSTHYIRCPSCNLESIPLRGQKSDSFNRQTNRIYSFDDTGKYYCGKCGHEWGRRTYVRLDKPEDEKKQPHYNKPETEAKPRQKRRGYGFTYVIVGFQDTASGFEPRRYRIMGSTIQINSDHPQYKQLASKKGPISARQLKIYQRQTALAAIIDKESENLSKDALKKYIIDGMFMMLSWYGQDIEPISIPEKPVNTSAPKNNKSVSNKLEKGEIGTAVEKLRERWGINKKSK